MTNYIKDNLLSTLMIIIMIIECTLIMYIEKNVYITDFMNSDTAGDVIFAKFLADSGCWIFSDSGCETPGRCPAPAVPRRTRRTGRCEAAPGQNRTTAG